MRTEIPRAVAFLTGVFILLGFFLTWSTGKEMAKYVLDWRVIVAAFALGLGAVNLVRVNARKLQAPSASWYEKLPSITLVLSLVLFSLLGIADGPQAYTYQYIYNNIFANASSTIFSLNAFFIASAAYRAFRARNRLAVVFLVSGVLVLLGNVGIGQMIWTRLPVISEWIMNVPNSAVQRGVLIGSALGVIAVGLRTILGLERAAIGGEGE